MWLLLPQITVAEILRHPGACNWVAENLLADIRTPFAIEPPPAGGSIGKFVKVDEHATVLCLWNGQARGPMQIADDHLLSIWTDPGDNTLGSIDEFREEALERLCQLAQRSWYNLNLPEHWKPKKLEGFPSIFAGDRRLLDIRVAYEVRSASNRKIVDVGTFFGRHDQRVLMVPAVEPDLLARLPKASDPPEDREIPSYRSESSLEADPDDRDLVMPVLVGKNRHLFSLCYSDWVAESGPLTKEQRRVIRHKIERPLRIHGPAGSGKTLILVLKALGLLREAQDQGKVCHVLAVLNSNAVRATVRAAIDTIDDCGFMATTHNDPQFLDVETLHGWCIRELGLENGPRYVLESDPIASKEKQCEVLEKVVSEILETKVRTARNLLSRDFIARIEGNREQLLRDLGWEIAIRIKGRGFRKSDQKLYIESPMRSFIGRGENTSDRYVVFYVYQKYEEYFEQHGLLDTDDVVLSMGARLATSLWDRQRRSMGYDYVLVDETHLFNENARRVLPYLTRGITKYLPLIMTFDEAQSIGGRRSIDLGRVGIEHSERRTLKYVHRSSPDILALARDLVERSPLVFTEFGSHEPIASMSSNELKRCRKPEVSYASNETEILEMVGKYCVNLRSHNYPRVGVIVFNTELLELLRSQLPKLVGTVQFVRERGELFAALPKPGVYLMTPETCGGLEFDGVILVGVDEGRVPPPMGDLSPQGYLSVQEEVFKELYTSATRSRYQLIFVCDVRRGLSSLVRPSVTAGLIEERSV